MEKHISHPSARLPWTWFGAAAAGGVPVGLLWWLLAPGGLNLITRTPALGDGTNPEVWLPRDLTLGGLLVFAGCLVAVFLTDKGGRAAQPAFLLSLAGGLVGAILAWQTGVLSGRLWGPAVDPTFVASVAFSLRSLSVLLLWPAATAVSVFALSLLNLLRKGPDAGSAPVAEGTSPGA
ncbi:hypothetical protein GCM10009712_19070 [Pseudarthrobacter sulfonivorans]|uniref:hypothetical protein n=1 Tax=Pseudarthrobacter sulfonivorans TaxID=121292 RepID=UPI00168ABD3F|nr:hypothetical protein [Pseudarthrobacter sulfonivorans]